MQNFKTNMQIEPEKFYSGIEAQKLLEIKSRQYIAKYIQEGYLLAIVTGGENGKRYLIKGEWIYDFKKRYKKGLVKSGKYTIQYLKVILNAALEYCEQNNIKTLDELNKHVENLCKKQQRLS